jgi:acetyltransferase-like isoleucine patch superfamily enzyme
MPGKSAESSTTANQLDLRTSPRHPVQVDGIANHVTIGDASEIESKIAITGDNNRLVIGNHCHIAGFAPVGGGTALIDPKSEPKSGPKPSAMTALSIQGSGNIIEIADGCRLGANLTVIGDNSRVRIGRACAINGFVSLLCPTGSALTVGAGTTMVQVSIQLHEPGQIVFGEDCMVSSQAYVALSDIHPIYDRASGARLNPAASVTIGNHVWLGLRSMIMKGATIGDGAVVAAGAIVSGSVPANAVMAGVPARVVRQNVAWRRELSEGAPEAMTRAPVPKHSWWPFPRSGRASSV